MKTKKTTTNRSAEREATIALRECEGEFGSVLTDEFLEDNYYDDDED